MSIYYEAAVFMFFEVGVFTTSFANFTEKHLCWSLFEAIFMKTKLQHRCFPVKFAKFLKTLSFTGHLSVAASVHC